MKTGAQLIAEERVRQIAEEGWTPGHDDIHVHGQMAAAALTYIEVELIRENYRPGYQEAQITEIMSQRWPWGEEWFKPSDDPVRNLVKAGALIAAEIDRLTRLEIP
jgi:hypothetical protein